MKGETSLQRAITQALKAIGVEFARTHAGTVRARGGFVHLSPPGWPDITGYMPDGSGRLLGIEVKVPGGYTERSRAAAQAEWRERAGKAGCVVGVVRSAQEAVELVQGAYLR